MIASMTMLSMTMEMTAPSRHRLVVASPPPPVAAGHDRAAAAGPAAERDAGEEEAARGEAHLRAGGAGDGQGENGAKLTFSTTIQPP